MAIDFKPNSDTKAKFDFQPTNATPEKQTEPSLLSRVGSFAKEVVTGAPKIAKNIADVALSQEGREEFSISLVDGGIPSIRNVLHNYNDLFWGGASRVFEKIGAETMAGWAREDQQMSREKAAKANQEVRDFLNSYQLTYGTENDTRNFWERITAPDGEQEVAKVLGMQMPTFAALLGVGVATRGANLPTVPAILGTSFALNSGDAYQQGKDYLEEQGIPLDREQENKLGKIAALVGATTAPLDTLGLERVMSPSKFVSFKNIFVRNLTNAALDVGTDVIAESGTEGLQELIQNAWAKTYNENQDLFEGVPEAMFGGGIFAGGSSVLVNVSNITRGGQSNTQVQANLEKTIQSIDNSQAFDTEALIAENPDMASKIYANEETKVLTPEFAEGRINDVAQKAENFQKGLGEKVRAAIDPSNTTYEDIVRTGKEIVEAAANQDSPFGGTASIVFNSAGLMSAGIAQRLKEGVAPETLVKNIVDGAKAAGVDFTEAQAKKAVDDVLKGYDTIAGDIKKKIAAGDSVNRIALELSQKSGVDTDQAVALVDRISQDVSRETPTAEETAARSKSTTVEDTKTALSNITEKIDESVLDRSPADLQSDFDTSQTAFESNVAELNENVADIKKRLDEAPDRTQVKKNLKTELSKAQAALRKAEEGFSSNITKQAESFRGFLSDFITKQYPDLKLSAADRDNLLDDIVGDSIGTGTGTIRSIVESRVQKVQKAAQPQRKASAAQTKEARYAKDSFAYTPSKDGTGIKTTDAEIAAKYGRYSRREDEYIIPNSKRAQFEAELRGDTPKKPAAQKKEKTQKAQVEEFLNKEGVASIKDVADATGILVPNVRRILGVGTKAGEFERVGEGVYTIKTPDGKEVAVVIPADARETLPRLAEEGFKADMVFLDIPYDTPAVKGGNRGVNYNLISVEDFSAILDAASTILRTADSPIVHFFSQAPSGMKAMQKYNDLFAEKGFVPLGRGEYQKTFKDGSPVTSPNGKVAKPEGIIVFNRSGNIEAAELNLDFQLVRPKGYQTEKPAEMIRKLVEMTTKEGDVVLDPFAGSGVVGAEAIRAGRKSVSIEKDAEVAEKITKPRVEEAAKEVKSSTAENVLREQIGNIFTVVEPVGNLWQSKGNTIFIALNKDRAGFVSWLRGKNFVADAQDAGNNVYQVTLKTPQKIADVGEKIGGARKDLFAAQREAYTRTISEAEYVSLPLAKLLPPLNYKELKDNGVSDEALGVYTFFRSELERRPTGRRSWKMNRWIDAVKALREIGSRILTVDEKTAGIVERANAISPDIAESLRLYKELDFVGNEKVRQFSVHKAVTTKGETLYVLRKGGNDVGGRFGGRWSKDFSDIVEVVKKMIEPKEGGEAADLTSNISVFRRGAEYIIAYKKGSRFFEFETFQSRDEALANYRNKEKLQEYADQLQEGVDFDRNTFRNQENREVKREYRKGDVSADTFMQEFGFRGVEFGNWVNQVERQQRLNSAYDALKDLALTIGIPERAISLNGELGFAFGARGKKGAAAHYEPDKIVINITKEQGAGTIAHEWWHALDNYLARKGGDTLSYLTDTLRYERPEVRDAFYELIQTIKKNGVYERSRKADQYKGHRYFTNRTELGARAFEVYVATKLAEKNQYNDFLVNLKSKAEIADMFGEVYPYATGDEIAPIVDALDRVFRELQVENNTRKALFSLKNDELFLTKEQGEIQTEMVAVGTDMSNGIISQEEGAKRLAELWSKARDTFSPEQLAILDAGDGKFKLNLGTSELAQARFDFLNDLKRRWNIDFDVYFVDSILAGTRTDATKQKNFIEAWGVYAYDTIAVVKDAVENTDRHETVHLTLDNAYRIPILKRNGITKENVLRAQAKQMGMDYDQTTAAQKTEIEEQVAVNFEKYKQGSYNPRGILRKFFALLKQMLARVKRLFDADPDVIRSYYELLNEGEEVSGELLRLENNGLIRSFIREGVLDLRGTDLAAGDQPTRKVPVISKFKLSEESDAYLKKTQSHYNELAEKTEKLEADAEQWKADLLADIEAAAEKAEQVDQTPSEVKEAARFTRKTPPKGTLTERGEEIVASLGFENKEAAQKEINEYFKRKVELVATRNRMRQLRKDIASVKAEGKDTKKALKDVERRLKLRRELLARKDFYTERGENRGRKQQMKMIYKRGVILRNLQDLIGLSDEKARQLIGGYGRQRLYLMSEEEFDNFVIEFVNRGQDIVSTLNARDSVKSLIQERRFEKEDNLRRALKLPTIDKMTQEQAAFFESILEKYEEGDVFLTQRQIETIHRTQWGDVKTEREMHQAIFEKTGISREAMETVEIDRTFQKYKNWLVLSRDNPMFAWLVDRRFKAKLTQEAEYVAFEEELNLLVRKARKSRERTFGEKVAQAFAPIDEVVFNYIESEDKPTFAEENQMTNEELELAHFLIGRLFEPARQYLTSEYGMQDRDNYITHLRRGLMETFVSAIKEGRGVKAGVTEAVREILTSQKEDAATFKILGGKTGDVLAFEKWFQFAMPRTGQLVPTKNVAKASLAYARAYFGKKSLDAFIPEAMALVKVQQQVKGFTPKGLPLDPTVEEFVKQYINDAKGRKIDFVTTQGDALDNALKLGIAWTAFKYLGFRPVLGLVNFIGEFVAVVRGTSTVEKWNGIKRSLNLTKSHRVNQAHKYFTGRNPVVELFDPKHGIVTRIKDAAMVLFSMASFYNNNFYLRAKMTEAEWQAELIEDDRMVTITKEMSKWRKTPFYISSLAGGTTVGSAFNQFATWALPIVNTTISDTHQLIKSVSKEGWKGFTTEEARSLGTTLALMGTIWFLAMGIKALDPDDDPNDRDIFFYVTRELNTLIGAFQVVWQIETRIPLLRDLLNLQKLIGQVISQEKYKQDGIGYGIGDSKAWVTAKKLVTPAFVKDAGTMIFGEAEREDTKNRLITEAVGAGEFDAEKAAQIAETVNPDGWNNVDGTRNEEEQAKYRADKVGELTALYNLQKNYPDNKVGQIITDKANKNNDDRIAAMVEYAKEVGVDKAYAELKDLHSDRNLCADPKKKTGCLVSGNLFKDFQRAKKDLQ